MLEKKFDIIQYKINKKSIERESNVNILGPEFLNGLPTSIRKSMDFRVETFGK